MSMHFSDSTEPLDKFGAFLIERIRDPAFRNFQLMDGQHWHDASARQIQERLASLPEDHRRTVQVCVFDAIDSALHDLLAALQESHDLKQGIEVIVDDANVAEASGMLNGELFGPNGWIARFGEFQSPLEIGQ